MPGPLLLYNPCMAKKPADVVSRAAANADAPSPGPQPPAAARANVGLQPAKETPVEDLAVGGVLPKPDIEPLLAHLKASGTGQLKIDAIKTAHARATSGEQFQRLCEQALPPGTMVKMLAFRG